MDYFERYVLESIDRNMVPADPSAPWRDAMESLAVRGYIRKDKLTKKGSLARYGSEGVEVKCLKCDEVMGLSKAISQTFTAGTPDFPGDTHASTFSAGGPGKLVDCWKCPKCGRSVRAE